jgi:hypothetical protein
VEGVVTVTLHVSVLVRPDAQVIVDPVVVVTDLPFSGAFALRRRDGRIQKRTWTRDRDDIIRSLVRGGRGSICRERGVSE